MFKGKIEKRVAEAIRRKIRVAEAQLVEEHKALQAEFDAKKQAIEESIVNEILSKII